jgi:hypothetical protein
MIIHNILMLCSHMVISSHNATAMLGLARHENVQPHHGSCLSLVKKLIVAYWYDMTYLACLEV